MFRFPVPTNKQAFNRYIAHSGEVSNICFTADDEYVISMGKEDKSIM